MTDYKLMVPGAFAVSGILASVATMLDSYSQAWLLAIASIVLGYGLWALLSCYEKIVITQERTLSDISKNHMELNINVTELVQQISAAQVAISTQTDKMEKNITGLAALERDFEDLAELMGTGFAKMQAQFQADLDSIKELHQKVGDDDVAMREAIRKDFQAIGTIIQDIYEKQMNASKEMLNYYATGTLDQIDINHRDLKEVIEILSQNNETYTNNISINVDTMINKLQNLLTAQFDDLNEKYQSAYDLMKNQPELLEEMKNELLALQKKQQDINVNDLKLMERMLNGR